MAALAQIHRFRFRRCGNTPNEIGKGREFGTARLQRFRIRLQSNHRPAARCRELLRMGFAEVVAVRFGVRCEWTEHRRLISIDIRQRRDRCVSALRSSARTLSQHGPRVRSDRFGAAEARSARQRRRDRWHRHVATDREQRLNGCRDHPQIGALQEHCTGDHAIDPRLDGDES